MPGLDLPEEPAAFAVSFHPRIVRRTVTLALPIIGGMLTQTAINLVDTALVGRLQPEVSIPGQAALGVSLLLFWAAGGFLSAIGVGTQTIVARRFGGRRLKEAGSTLTNSLSAAAASSIVMAVAGYFLIPVVFPYLNREPDVVRLGIIYTQMRFIGLPSMVLIIAAKGFFDGIGKTYVHMIAAFMMNAVNLVLALGLVFGLWGMPRMEVRGAALAAVISSYLGLLVMAGWLFVPFCRQFAIFRRRNLSLKTCGRIVGLSLPTGAATVIAMTGFLLFFKIISIADLRVPDEIEGLFASGSKIIIDILSVSFMTCIAFGTAASTLVSQSMGAGRPQQAERCGWEAVKVGMLVIGTLGIVTFLFPVPFLRIFTDKAIVISSSIPALKLMGLLEWMIAAAMIFMYSLFGAGNTKFVMVAELFMHFGVFIPSAYALVVLYDYSMIGAWIGGAIYVVGLGLLLGWKFREGKWKTLSV